MLPGIQQFDLTGRSVIVTGGSMGLGEAIAAGLASAGADVLVTSRHQDKALAVAERISSDFGRRAVGLAADVTDESAVAAMVETAIQEFGKVDILVNNAGLMFRGAIEEMSLQQFKDVHETNVDGLWLCSRAVVPHMKERRSGRIINLASTLGLVGSSNRTAYASSKGAVVQMTRALGLELADSNVTVNAICPGPFLTPMNESNLASEEASAAIVASVPLGRWGELAEIQGAAIFLASDAASYVTGSVVTVDGGWTAQ